MKNLNWAILGTGVIANEMAIVFKKAGRQIYAIGNRTYDKAIAFSKKHKIEKVYDDFHEMFSDPEVDIVYITTPHNTHIQFILEALKNGKHILCEKAITLNSDELNQAINVAKEKKLILAEAMTIYHMPIYKKIKEEIQNKKLGQVRMIQMNFGSYKEYDMENRFFNPNLAGGALLDIGIYAISFVRWFMSECPKQIVSQVKYAPSGVDEQVGILLMNTKEEMATITLSLHAKQPKRGLVVCENGYIEVNEYPRSMSARIVITETGESEEITIGDTEDALYYEMLDMEAAIQGENVTFLEYSKDVMEIMTQIRKDWGFTYPEERGKVNEK